MEKLICQDGCSYLLDNNLCLHCAYDMLKNNNFQTINVNGNDCTCLKILMKTNIYYCFKAIQIIDNPRKISFVDLSSNIRTYYCVGKEEFNNLFKSHNFLNPYFLTDDNQRVFLKNCTDLWNFLKSDHSIIYEFSLQEQTNQIFEEGMRQIIHKVDLSNITLNSQLYSNCHQIQILDSKEREVLTEDLIDFSSGKNQYFYFTGPIGIGKTTTLLLFQRLQVGKYDVLYINLKWHKKNFEKSNFIEILHKELVYLCFQNLEQYQSIINYISNLYYTHKNLWSYMVFLREMITYLLKFTDKNFIFIFDQYKKKIDEDLYISKTLKEEIINKKVHVIICSSINDKEIGTNLKYLWKKGFYCDNMLPYKYYSTLLSTNSFINSYNGIQKKYGEKFNFYPCYMKEIVNKSEKEIENYIYKTENHISSKILELYGNNYVDSYANIIKLLSPSKIDIPLTKEIFIELVDKIPLKYICVSKREGFFYLTYHFNLIKEVLVNIIICSLQNLSNEQFRNSIIPMKELPGELFENYIHLMILNTNPFRNISVLIKKEVDSVITLNPSSVKVQSEVPSDINKIFMIEKNKIEQEENVYFIQTSKNAKHYDSAILFNKNKKWKFILFQITLYKEEKKRLKRTTIMKDCYQIQTNIKKINEKVIIDIVDFHFFYIFCLEKLDTNTLTYCIRNQISFLLFSISSNQFLSKELDLTELSSISFSNSLLKNLGSLSDNMQYLNTLHNTFNTFLNRKRRIEFTQEEANGGGEFDITKINSYEELNKFLENKINEKILKQLMEYYKNQINVEISIDEIKSLLLYQYTIYNQFKVYFDFIGKVNSKGSCEFSNNVIITVIECSKGSFIFKNDSIYDVINFKKITKDKEKEKIAYTILYEKITKWFFVNRNDIKKLTDDIYEDQTPEFD